MTTALAAVALGIVIGAVLGGLGGGGAILTVPALVYVLGQSPQEATTASLVIVGLTAATSVVSYARGSRVRWGVGITFGLAGLPATWLGSMVNHRLDGDMLLLAFSGLIVVAAAAMIADQRRGPAPPPETDRAPDTTDSTGSTGNGTATTTQVRERTEHRVAAIPLVVAGLGVGFLTGLFGVGGGFVIVPALVLLLRLPMPQVVGTSLVIVAINSASSLAARASTAEFDWQVIVPFTLAAMTASLAGKRVADRLPARQLKLVFAVLLLLVAGYTGWQSVIAL